MDKGVWATDGVPTPEHGKSPEITEKPRTPNIETNILFEKIIRLRTFILFKNSKSKLNQLKNISLKEMFVHTLKQLKNKKNLSFSNKIYGVSRVGGVWVG